MAIGAVGRPLQVSKAAGSPSEGQWQNIDSFARVLEEKLVQVDALQKKADSLLEGFLTGQVRDVHEVMLAAQQAEIALHLTVEIRNRVIEAYQEIARMQL